MAFKSFLWCMGLRHGTIVFVILHWGWLCFLATRIIDHAGENREYVLYLRFFGDWMKVVKIIMVYIVEIPLSFLVGLVLLIGVLVNNTNYLQCAILLEIVAILCETILQLWCHRLYFLYLTSRAVLFFAFVTWMRVATVVLTNSLRKQMADELRIDHINYLRESFVQPFRRAMADAVDRAEAGTARADGAKGRREP